MVDKISSRDRNIDILVESPAYFWWRDNVQSKMVKNKPWNQLNYERFGIFSRFAPVFNNVFAIISGLAAI